MYFGTKKEVPDSVFNALAQTPPMGWNSWNKFGCNVSEQLIKEMADAMIATGMKDAGYEYLVIDDCWQVGRDEEGNIQVDPKRFPNGMKALADYVHAKGLKMGIYSCAGSETCQGRPGSRGYQFQDARTIRRMGNRLPEIRWCSNEGQKGGSCLPYHERRAESMRTSYCIQHLRMGGRMNHGTGEKVSDIYGASLLTYAIATSVYSTGEVWEYSTL